MHLNCHCELWILWRTRKKITIYVAKHGLKEAGGLPWVASAAARKGVISETAFSLAYLLALCRVLLLGVAVANQVKFAGWNENIVGVLTYL